jgi:hypothetical protein
MGTYVAALLLTLVIEVPLYAGVLVGGLKVGKFRAFKLAAGINLATHPALWVIFWLISGTAPGPSLTFSGLLAACVIEWAILAYLLRRDRIVLAITAVVANTVSAVLLLIS